MLDIGNTHPETLYDFATTLDATNWTCLDPNSELYKAFREIHDSVWGQLPELIVIDFRDPDTLPTPRPPLSMIWDEETERYI